MSALQKRFAKWWGDISGAGDPFRRTLLVQEAYAAGWKDCRIEELERAATPPAANRLYVAGPMSGYQDLNFPAFHCQTARLRALGYDVVNPAEINPNFCAKWNDCMRADIQGLMTCAGIAMLPGWTRSKGASLEHYIAVALEIPVYMASDLTEPAQESAASAAAA
ncbi:MAG: DUF4406 domain-containing protein [Janthinobacterium lividum]